MSMDNDCNEFLGDHSSKENDPRALEFEAAMERLEDILRNCLVTRDSTRVKFWKTGPDGETMIRYLSIEDLRCLGSAMLTVADGLAGGYPPPSTSP